MSEIRIAIVDDEKHIRLMLKTALRAGGFDVVGEASNGQEALELFRSLKPDITLLDINMPHMTGEEALAEILQEDPSAVVIMLTSLAEQECVLRAIESGASHYIRKDTPLAEIQFLIRETWARKAAAHD